jgi:predicted MFS family arabinose efflux permease
MESLEQRTRKTFRNDLVRGACGGVLETGWHVFALLLAVRVFQASPEIKASIAAAGPYGLLLTPLSLFLVTRLRLPAAVACSTFLLLSGFFLVLTAFSQSLAWFAFAVITAAVLFSQQMPLMVHIYAENYSATSRGSRLSNSIALTVITTGLFALGGGVLLDYDLNLYPLLIALMALAALGSAWAVRRMPSSPLPASTSRNPLADLSYAWKDRMFGWMLFVWMLMGLGNLITIPLRVEYMANPVFGINATNSQVALIIAIVPSLARLLTTHLWGYLFDRLNFIVVRTMLNACFLVAILIFFNSTSLVILGLASVIFGVGTAGGNIAWSLWVTKLAPEGKAANYMSVHTFTTGLRGAAAPYLGFFLINRFSPETSALLAAGLIALSIFILMPMKSRW